MKDPKNMTSTEKYNHIFENQNDYYVANRFGWFESLLSLELTNEDFNFFLDL